MHACMVLVTDAHVGPGCYSSLEVSNFIHKWDGLANYTIKGRFLATHTKEAIMM